MLIKDIISKEEVAKHQTKVEQLRDDMNAITVESKEDLISITGHIAQTKEVSKLITGVRDKYIAPAKQIIDQAKSDFDPIIKMCAEVESILKEKAQTYMIKEQKREEQEKAKILDDKRTKVDTKVEKLSEVKESEKVAKSDKGSLGMSMVNELVIVDEALIPEEYYKPRELDLVKIKKVAFAGVEVPGVRVDKKPQMSMRGVK